MYSELMYRGFHLAWKICGPMAFPVAQATTKRFSVSGESICGDDVLTEDGVDDRLLGLTGNVSGDHGVHRWVDGLEALHDVESDKQTTFGVATGSDGDEDDRADNVDNGVADHAVDSLLSLRTEPSEQALAKANTGGMFSCSPDEEVQDDLEDGEGDGNEERGGDSEVEGSVDEKRVEGVETTDDERLGEHHEE